MMFAADLEPTQWFCDFRYTKPTKWSLRPKRTARRTLSERRQRREARRARGKR